ncbi:PAAR repeat-containing protein [Variovorax paradoxus]|uniref:PAAR repeat-containing protein n=1 Tax=Variovorax paradoxus TaxID=34073 RepID=A0A0D0KYT3_VARPD|nr:PAAR repeat-containing protein [Variovorax paradoxus]
MSDLIVCVGDTTTHGGTVLEGFSSFSIDGKIPAGVGHMVACPLCKGVFPISSGGRRAKVQGMEIAVDGMKTACGAALIASQSRAGIE